jgi:3-methylcrotonyl-CoA carboxylase alpha subunit
VFDCLLVANRGEIACRVLRTARRLGIRTVAVHSDADAGALHVAMADRAVRIGPASARESYLNARALIEAARETGAQAIHPGYGFLAENADFAQACADAGLVFVGPPPAAIRAMGSKIGAKRLMEAAGVPLVPGYHGDAQDDATFAREAARIGYPVLIKASAGGGGKGMRIVGSPAELPSALAAARREALKAFADDRLLLERYLERPRHIEVQVFADVHGHCIHLYERDCSIQRRHQKVIEEAPAPHLAPARRQAMGEAAVRAARSVGYVNAGTVEFIAAGDEFYFMEMNTRLQVEHPVTELVTGLDLVEWQLRVAAGEPLPLAQEDVPLRGAAIEARLYAEDPSRDFLPATGRLWHLRWPSSERVRIDAGVREGDEITVHYDPMIAKLIVWAESRGAAVTRLRDALAACELGGPVTNLALLHAIASHPAFAAGRVHTGFIAEHAATLSTALTSEERAHAIALAATGLLLNERSTANGSPWDLADGWRLNAPDAIRTDLVFEGTPCPLRIESRGDAFRVLHEGRTLEVREATLRDGRLHARVDGVRHDVGWLLRDERIHLFFNGRHVVFDGPDHASDVRNETEAGGLRSPMPGQVIQVLVRSGDAVKRGQPLMIVEAMKMEHTILAPTDGIVVDVAFAAGDRVEEGAQLLRVKSPSSG